jgi:hypothetical protein
MFCFSILRFGNHRVPSVGWKNIGVASSFHSIGYEAQCHEIECKIPDSTEGFGVRG